MMAAASYVTGSHAIKFGMTNVWGTNSRAFTSHAEINTLVFSAGNPIAVAVANTPAAAEQKVNSDLGMYLQDAWTRKRLTLNYGARYDHFNAEVPAQGSAAGPWIQARNFPAIKNVPNWNDWSVRLAGAYDLFGTGKTALKLNAGKYVASQAAGYAANFNGMTYSTQTRRWNDADRNRSIRAEGQRDLRIQPGDQRLEDAHGHHGRPVHSLRPADELLALSSVVSGFSRTR
jgi:hypothetical protein